jgi:hypothetical protein
MTTYDVALEDSNPNPRRWCDNMSTSPGFLSSSAPR